MGSRWLTGRRHWRSGEQSDADFGAVRKRARDAREANGLSFHWRLQLALPWRFLEDQELLSVS